MVKNDKTPDYVKISAYLFIDEYEKRVGKVRGVVFNKFMTLLNYELLSEKNVNINLPHCWYRWGDEVVKYYLRPYTKWDHEDLGITTVAWKGRIPENMSLGDPTVAEIRKIVKQYIKNYSDDDGWERAIDKLYEKAPYEFQNEYRKVRENLKGAVNGNYIRNYSKSVLAPLFENAMNSFPAEFSMIKKEKIDFEYVLNAAVDKDAPIEVIREIIEEFWFLFCYYLRVDKKCYANIKKETLGVWKSSIPWERELYKRSLQDHAFNLELYGINKTVDALLNDRDVRIKEFNDLLDEFIAADNDRGASGNDQ